MKAKRSVVLLGSMLAVASFAAQGTAFASDEGTVKPEEEKTAVQSIVAETQQGKENISKKESTNSSSQDRASANDQVSEPSGERATEADRATTYAAPEKEDYQDKVKAEYSAEVAHSGYSVDALPWKVNREKTINLGASKDLLHQKVKVLNEDQDGYYAEIEDEKGNYKGWIDTRAFARKRVKSYDTQIIAGGFSVDSKPWGEAGYAKKGMTDDYVGQTVRVVMHNDRDLYFQALLNGKELGWIDYRAFATSYVQSTERVYKGGFAIKQGGKVVGNTADHFGQIATVYRLKRDKNQAIIKVNNKVLGFVSAGAVNTDNRPYDVYVISSKYALDNRPWNEHGKTNLGQSSALAYEKVRVYNVNASKTYYLIGDQSGKMYWIDYRALSKTTGPNVTVLSKGYSIDSKPWGVAGYQTIGKTDQLIGKDVQLLGTNDNQRYYLIKTRDNSAAWIDYRAFARPVSQQEKQVIYLDAGHGGKEPGAMYYGVSEKDINLQVTKMLQASLEREGYTVLMTRTADDFVDFLTERSRRVNATNASIFISVHHNAMPNNTSVQGIETYYYGYRPDKAVLINQKMHNDPKRLADSRRLAQSIHREVVRASGAPDRSVRQQSFAVLRETRVPAVLLELGYMSNRQELGKITNRNYQKVLVSAITRGVKTYFGKK